MISISHIYTVGEVNEGLNRLIAGSGKFQGICVAGEVTGFKRAASGHLYFSLKDEKGLLPCVMWKSYAAHLRFPIQNGDRIQAFGSIEIYSAGGRYQFYLSDARPDGEGEFLLRLKKLKERLQKEGLFDASHKQSIPKYAKRVGVVTAATGAAIRDIQSIHQKKNPYIEVYLYPTAVQGERAAAEIVRGIECLDDFGVDVIIVGRGGGSKEDLSQYNDERVARAIYDCWTPVISAVGHEVDTSISDLVADLSVPTPTAAAETVFWDASEFISQVTAYQEAMTRSMERRIATLHQQLDYKKEQLRRRSPDARVNEMRQRLDDEQETMTRLMENRIRSAKERLRGYDRLPMLTERVLTRKKHKFQLYVEKLDGLSPLKKLMSGYAYVSDEKGRNIRSVEQVSEGEMLRIQLADGSIGAKVHEVKLDGRKYGKK